MLSAVRRLPLLTVLCATAALTIAGCDTGGLLLVEHKKPAVTGPSVNEMSNAGTYASNGKYRVFYSFGQGTPNQGVGTSSQNRLNGGIVGAAHSN
jgi:hypothetical protein